jgi:hypothetical protein
LNAPRREARIAAAPIREERQVFPLTIPEDFRRPSHNPTAAGSEWASKADRPETDMTGAKSLAAGRGFAPARWLVYGERRSKYAISAASSAAAR